MKQSVKLDTCKWTVLSFSITFWCYFPHHPVLKLPPSSEEHMPCLNKTTTRNGLSSARIVTAMLETESRVIGSKWRLCRHSRLSSMVKNKSTKAHGVSQQAAVKSTEVKQELMHKCTWTTQRTEWSQTISQKFTSCHLYLATFLETSVETVTVWRRIHKDDWEDNCGAQRVRLRLPSTTSLILQMVHRF